MEYQGDASSRARYGEIHGSIGPYQQSHEMQQMYVQMQEPRTPDGQQVHHVPQMREFSAQNQYVYQQNEQYTPDPATIPSNAYYQAASQPQYHFPRYTARPQQQFPQFSNSVQLHMPSSNQSQQQRSQPLQKQAPWPVEQNSLRQQHRPSVSVESVKSLNKPKQSTGQPIDSQMLMVSLAEEYFEAAQNLTSHVARNMTPASLEEYHGLIATGLGCLESVLKKTRLAPKLEARIRLRYAGVLFDETDNYMEAETALSRGILLCEQNRYLDLKYSMQVLLSQILYKKNPKASLKGLERHCADTEAYRHHSWEYVFRFLKTSLSLKSPKTSDHQAALHDLRYISSLASSRADHAIFILASLIEILACISSPGPESQEQIRRAFAAASTYQLEADAKIPQLAALIQILDVTSSLLHDLPAVAIQKQSRMLEIFKATTQSSLSNAINLPIAKSPSQIQLVSRDTRGILETMDDGRDSLVISFLNSDDMHALIYLLSGIALLHNIMADRKAIYVLREGLLSLSDSKPLQIGNSPLHKVLEKCQWRRMFVCYFHVYLIFCSLAISDWKSAKDYLSKLNSAIHSLESSSRGPLENFRTYLFALYLQSIGDLENALKEFTNPRLHLPNENDPVTEPEQQIQYDLSLLASMNVISILQNDRYRDIVQNNTMVSRLEPLCMKHPNKDIQTAFKLLKALVLTEPPVGITKTKNYLSSALDTAKATANKQFICIALSTLYSKFFVGHAGDQSEKAARAAVQQAKSARNPLWVSVASGMLASNLDLQGKSEEAQSTRAEASRLSALAFPKPH